MPTNKKRSALSYIPGYSNNAVLQLIIASALLYIMLSISWAIVMLVYGDAANFNNYFIPNIAVPHLAVFRHKWWTIFTYGWLQYPNGFFELLSNMLWLYCFGSVVQMLLGHKQVIPLFAYSLVMGGIVYLGAQYLPGELGKCPPLILGPRAGLVGMATAAFTLTPKYRFYINDHFSIPMGVVAGIFAVLMVFSTGFYIPMLLMIVGGGLAGFVYVKLLQTGYRPGAWMYDLPARMENIVTPNENVIRRARSNKRNEVMSQVDTKQSISQKRVDDILDKINQKGYNSLTSEEKELLMRAGSGEEN
jgi:membrane associated rhomboid family serine protease